MVGHSKWSKAKRIKGPLDARRGAAFSKPGEEITVAARPGGDGLSGSPCLRPAVETARAADRPGDSLGCATRKGPGGMEGGNHEKVLHETCAPGGVAMVIEAVTDHKNRTAANLRLTFSKHHAGLAASGSALCRFCKKGPITITCSLTDEDRLLESPHDAGAEAIFTGDTHHAVTPPPDRFHAVAKAFRRGSLTFDPQKFTHLLGSTVFATDGDPAARVPKSHEVRDDAQNVSSNFDVPAEISARPSV